MPLSLCHWNAIASAATLIFFFDSAVGSKLKDNVTAFAFALGLLATNSGVASSASWRLAHVHLGAVALSQCLGMIRGPIRIDFGWKGYSSPSALRLLH